MTGAHTNITHSSPHEPRRARLARVAGISLAGAALLLPSVALGQEGGGLPQLDISTFSGQIFWLVVAFVTMYVLFSKVALPRVGEVLNERENRISGDLGEAEALKAKADEVRQAYEAAIAEADRKARLVVGETTVETNAEVEKRLNAAVEGIENRIAEAESRINAAREAAMADVRGIAIDVAGDASARLTDASVDKPDVEAAVDAAMQERV